MVRVSNMCVRLFSSGLCASVACSCVRSISLVRERLLPFQLNRNKTGIIVAVPGSFIKPFRTAIAALLLCGGVRAFAADPPKGVNLYSVAQEIALGRQMAAEVEKQAQLVSDPVIAEY